MDKIFLKEQQNIEIVKLKENFKQKLIERGLSYIDAYNSVSIQCMKILFISIMFTGREPYALKEIKNCAIVHTNKRKYPEPVHTSIL